MNDMVVTSVGLMLIAFALGAAAGLVLGGIGLRGVAARPQTPMLDVVEVFTAGVVVPFKAADSQASPQPAPRPAAEPAPRPAYMPVPRYEMAASNVAIIRGDSSLQTRVSSLVAMTPESVEAAVQQAGSGLSPVRLDGPKGAPDDLTLISGVTEQSQRMLNELGIYHFWQVAGWTPEHVAWLSSRVDGPGRIARENWMAQAARLSDRI